MDYKDSPWFQDKLTALFGIIVGAFFVAVSWYHLEDASLYRALPQQVFLDQYNRPIGKQDLMMETFHNPGYRKDGVNGGTAEDFLKESLLSMFSYDYRDLSNGSAFREFLKWCSEDEAYDLYVNAFSNLSSQRIIRAQNGISEANVLGGFTFVGDATRPYETSSGLKLSAKTYKFEGKMLVTVYGEKEYPTVYNVTAILQRALIQDKMAGYQLIELEMR
jgi:hypothetical protein